MKEKYPKAFAFNRKNKETGEVAAVYRAWSDGSISTILNNKCYIGTYEYRKRVKDKETIEITDIVPRIIEDEVFYECQENIKKNTRNYYRSKKYLFMQKLVCPKCERVMACSGTTKTKSNRDYHYYKCKDCGEFFREEHVEKALMEELALILEVYLILEYNYVVIDDDTAKELNKGKLNNKIRYAIDSISIEQRLNNSNYTFVKHLWNLASYEMRSDFMYTYIDSLKIKKYKVHGEKEPRIKLLDLKLKPSKFKKIFGMVEKNMIDFVEIESSGNDISEAIFSSRKQADEYIEVLRKKYKINVIDISKWEMWNNRDNVFKQISIISNRAVEKNNILWLELVT
ncbi:MAG: recombinase family protein [Bacilli bacterium]